MNCRLYDSIQHAPTADWHRATSGDTGFAADPRLLQLQQQTLADQCRCWIAIVHDGTGQPVAAAALALFHVDALLTARAPLQRAAGVVRRAWPGFLRYGVLFCGLPLPSGGSHLWIVPTADRRAVLAALDRQLRELAAAERAMLIVFKELDATQAAEGTELTALGYLRGAIPPLHVLRGTFRDFADYRAALRAGYRRQINASLRKSEAAGLRVRHLHDPAEIERAFTDDLHRLYEAVWSRAEARLEKFPADFFRQAARAFPGQASLTLLEHHDRPVAFSFGLTQGQTYANFYCGVDYTLNPTADLYFNVFYQNLDDAFVRGCREIHLGQTSDDFKTRLGSEPRPLAFYVRARRPLFHAGLRTIARWVFPDPPLVRAIDVFKSNGSP
jgi:predicted N-acyltransferase